MTRREALGSAATAPLALAVFSVLGAAPERQLPTMDQLINLAEHGTRTEYYGAILAQALAETGRIAKENDNGTVTLYHAELVRERDGHQSWAWRRTTIRGSSELVPSELLPAFSPADRGDSFPADVPFHPMSY
jgi:hypothetical protein